jgi:hypothetical protein
LFNMSLPADLHPEGLADHPLERSGLAVGRPELQLRVARGPELQQHVFAAVVKFDPGDGLRMAAIEILGQAQHRGERAHGAAPPAAQVAEALVPPARHATPMIPRNEGDCFDLVRLEPPQIVVPDEIVRMFMMPLVADVHADVVEQRRVLEPFAFAIRQSVDAARVVEQRR